MHESDHKEKTTTIKNSVVVVVWVVHEHIHHMHPPRVSVVRHVDAYGGYVRMPPKQQPEHSF